MWGCPWGGGLREYSPQENFFNMRPHKPYFLIKNI